MPSPILLISDNADDASFLSQVSVMTESPLHLVSNAKNAIEFLSAEDCSDIFLDVTQVRTLNEFEMEAQKRFGLFSDRVQPQKFHFISQRALYETRDVIKSPFFGCFLQRTTENIEASGKFYSRFVNANRKGLTQDLKQFLNENGKVQKVVLTHSDQKQEAAEAVRQYLIAAKVPARMSNVIANTVDELLMNAIFDAPCDEFGKSLYTSTTRNQSRPLNGKDEVTMSIGFDGFCVGVCVTDQFGNIDRNRLLNHVSSNYKNQDYTAKQGLAGAGLGVATINNSGGSLIYHCQSGQRTDVTLLHQVFASYLEFKNQFNFFAAKFYV